MPDSSKIVIAIDGPAGAGKSTVCRIVADRLGLRLLDTGAMYRCIALKAMRTGLEDIGSVEAMASVTQITFEPGDPQRVLLDGEDVTDEIRTLEVGEKASMISSHPPVRVVLVAQQKALIADGGCILEGRDTTTVVAPDADVKIFLTASIEERASRRHKEMAERGEKRRLQEVVIDVIKRDYRDYTREGSPITLAENAQIIETFDLTPEEVAKKIVDLAYRTDS